jgi:hypothetical protein
MESFIKFLVSGGRFGFELGYRIDRDWKFRRGGRREEGL